MTQRRIANAHPNLLWSAAVCWLASMACSAGDDDASGVPSFGGVTPGPSSPSGAGSVTNPGPDSQGVPTLPTGPVTGAGGSTSETVPEGQSGALPVDNTAGAANAVSSSGAGGSTMVGMTPAQGAGGSQMPPAMDSPPQDPPPVSGVDCGNLFLCDGFENLTVGAQPDPAIWTLRRNYDNQWPLTNFAVDNSTAHSGTQSLKLTASPNGPVGVIAAGPGDRFFLRVWMQLESPAANAPVYIGIGTGEGSEIRMRSKTGALVINAAQGDGLAPDPANCQGCIAPPSGWFCAEMFVDRVAENATLWINGVEAGSVVNNQGWHSGGTWPTSFAQVRIGPMGLEGGSSTTWIDDVAIGSDRIGCN